jgi:uncharacterized membrane protein HdeD (DUF308 family)
MNSDILHNIAGGILILSAMFLTMGLIRPMNVLWWTQDKTRGKVLMIYGVIALIAGIIFFVTIQPNQDPIKDETRTDAPSQ